MGKIIVRNKSKLSDIDAMLRVQVVMEGGLVSNNGTQYCYATTWTDGVYVYADKTRSGTFTFVVDNRET